MIEQRKADVADNSGTTAGKPSRLTYDTCMKSAVEKKAFGVVEVWWFLHSLEQSFILLGIFFPLKISACLYNPSICTSIPDL